MSVGSDFHSPRSESADRQKVRSAFWFSRELACVASVSVRFRSKERGTRVKDRSKMAFFGSCFISRAAKTENPVPRSFFAPKPNGNACYAGYKGIFSPEWTVNWTSVKFSVRKITPEEWLIAINCSWWIFLVYFHYLLLLCFSKMFRALLFRKFLFWFGCCFLSSAESVLHTT